MSNFTGKEDESNPHFVLHEIETLLSEKKMLKSIEPNKASHNLDMNKNDENMETKNQFDNFDKGKPTKHFTNKIFY